MRAPRPIALEMRRALRRSQAFPGLPPAPAPQPGIEDRADPPDVEEPAAGFGKPTHCRIIATESSWSAAGAEQYPETC